MSSLPHGAGAVSKKEGPLAMSDLTKSKLLSYSNFPQVIHQ